MAFSYVEMMNSFGLAEYAELPQFEPSVKSALTVPLADSRLGLFASCGVHLPEQKPFEPINDLTFRLVPREAPVAQLTFDHPSPIRGYALQDLNVAYPRDRLVELERAGIFGELAPHAASMLGSITTYTALAEQAVPKLAEIYKDMAVDAVLLVPFCPACHRATSIVARGLEARGVPTVMLTVLREMADAFKPARPVFLDYPLGASAGRPNDPQNQREVLTATLQAGWAMEGTKWHIEDLPFQFVEDGSRAWEDEVRDIYAVQGRTIHRSRVAEHTEVGESLVGHESEFTVRCAC
jgi:D-proline reductase (dithiol) PrdB